MKFTIKCQTKSGRSFLLPAHGRGGARATIDNDSPSASEKILAKPRSRVGASPKATHRSVRVLFKKVRALSRNCDQMQLLSFLWAFACSLASPSARLVSQINCPQNSHIRIGRGGRI